MFEILVVIYMVLDVFHKLWLEEQIAKCMEEKNVK